MGFFCKLTHLFNTSYGTPLCQAMDSEQHRVPAPSRNFKVYYKVDTPQEFKKKKKKQQRLLTIHVLKLYVGYPLGTVNFLEDRINILL